MSQQTQSAVTGIVDQLHLSGPAVFSADDSLSFSDLFTLPFILPSAHSFIITMYGIMFLFLVFLFFLSADVDETPAWEARIIKNEHDKLMGHDQIKGEGRAEDKMNLVNIGRRWYRQKADRNANRNANRNADRSANETLATRSRVTSTIKAYLTTTSTTFNNRIASTTRNAEYYKPTTASKKTDNKKTDKKTTSTKTGTKTGTSKKKPFSDSDSFSCPLSGSDSDSPKKSDTESAYCPPVFSPKNATKSLLSPTKSSLSPTKSLLSPTKSSLSKSRPSLAAGKSRDVAVGPWNSSASSTHGDNSSTSGMRMSGTRIPKYERQPKVHDRVRESDKFAKFY